MDRNQNQIITAAYAKLNKMILDKDLDQITPTKIRRVNLKWRPSHWLFREQIYPNFKKMRRRKA